MMPTNLPSLLTAKTKLACWAPWTAWIPEQQETRDRIGAKVVEVQIAIRLVQQPNLPSARCWEHGAAINVQCLPPRGAKMEILA
jgi:hypothetical protein